MLELFTKTENLDVSTNLKVNMHDSWGMPLDPQLAEQNPDFKLFDTDCPLFDVSIPLTEPWAETTISTMSSNGDSSALGYDNESPPDSLLVSSTFLPRNRILSSEPDFVLRSSDGIRFYVHSTAFSSTVADMMPSLTAVDGAENLPIFDVEDNSNVLNIVLHAIYGMSCSQFNHGFSEIVKAVDRLPRYGARPKELLVESHPVYDLILSLSPLYSLPAFALAARHEIESLAIACSSRLLSFPLDSISDEVAESIGPVYLKRLLVLHHQRRRTLNELLTRRIHPHPVTPECDFAKQQSVDRAWTLTAAYFVLDPQAGVSNQKLESTFGSLLPHIQCDSCRKLVRAHLDRVIAEWSLTKNTI